MASSLRIAEVADRVGISTSTVRYYERVGVLPAPMRADNGYRVYDDVTVERLGFISRAKQLGCSLEEIAGLVTAWDGGECGPVQDRLRSLVADKIAAAQVEVVQLITLSAELRNAAAALERHRPQGRCDDRCGCVTEAEPIEGEVADEVFAIELTDKPINGDEPVACTLGSDLVRGRIDEWNALFDTPTDSPDQGVLSSAVAGGVRVELDGGVDVSELVRLATAEQDCCRLFTFNITIDERGIALEVTAPDDALDVVYAAFGAPA